MNLIKPVSFLLLLFLSFVAVSQGYRTNSVYTQNFDDPEAFYFTSENYPVKADGKTDVSDVLQSAINQLKREKNYGILFIPEGKYLISKTIFIPPAIRLIGYGKNRPEIVLAKNSPGYQTGEEKYMVWFTGSLIENEEAPRDASPGTFYSAISNIDFKIEKGNTNAVALRTHYAQHGFISHSVINIGDGKAGISQVGNEIENVSFIGGDYGITTGPTSPSWPMMMVDVYFEGQKKAAVQSHNSGLAIVSMHAKNTPVVMEIEEDANDRLFLENCVFENISDAGILLNDKKSTLTQLNMLNVSCSKVPVFARFRQSNKTLGSEEKSYLVKEFVHGLIMEKLGDNSQFETIFQTEKINNLPVLSEREIPSLPLMEQWVNIKSLGAKGDGKTDDYEVIKDAINKHDNIYFPQGWYRISNTLKMNSESKLIGLHPWATQFVLNESEPEFSGFGGPVPMLESSEGGNNQINGIGISTGAYNYRAVGVKWMAGEKSYVNDIKFVGGHGTMRKPGERSGYRRGPRQISSPGNPVYEQGMDLAWDNQYWSLWITNNGGGIFKDIWTANTYATSGLFVSNTSTPGKIYAISLEHHVRNEAWFDKVSNWKMYAFQLEEEGREGKECQMIEISDCDNLMFANLWMYRVIRVTTPKRFGMRLWNSKNIEIKNLHNYTQKLWVTEFPVWDVNKELACYPWELAKLSVSGNEPSNLPANEPVRKRASGFNFAQGITSDSKGNVYFCETRKKRVYKWSVENEQVTLLADFPFQPFVLATDSEDNLLVVCRYDPQPGYLINGEQESVKRLPDDNPAYSSWGNSGWAALCYSINPDNPAATFKIMPRVATSDIDKFEKTYYPSSRWHYTFDEAVVYYPDSAFVAPDGKTFIQETYDIGRCSELSEAIPGNSIYASDEISKRTVKMDVGEKGKLSNLEEILPRGETSFAIDKNGNLYVADGQIFVFDKNLNEINRINVPERPVSITFGGNDKSTLFITTNSSLYSYRVN